MIQCLKMFQGKSAVSPTDLFTLAPSLGRETISLTCAIPALIQMSGNNLLLCDVLTPGTRSRNMYPSCQGISKAALKALEKFQSLAWLCTNFKSELKGRKGKSLLTEAIENRLRQLQEAVQKNTELFVSSAKTHEQTVKNHTTMIEKSMKSLEAQTSKQSKVLELTAQHHKAS